MFGGFMQAQPPSVIWNASITPVASEDKVIPPPAQRAMAGRAKAQVTEVAGSHAIYVSKPAEIAKLIQQAADARAENKASLTYHWRRFRVFAGDLFWASAQEVFRCVHHVCTRASG